MHIKEVDDGKIAIPESDEEHKICEILVEKGLVEYAHGGYWLTKDGVELCKYMGWWK